MFHASKPQLQKLLYAIEEIKEVLADTVKYEASGNLSYLQLLQLLFDKEQLSKDLLHELQNTITETHYTIDYNLAASIAMYDLVVKVQEAAGDTSYSKNDFNKEFGKIPQFEARLSMVFKNNKLKNVLKLTLINKSGLKKSPSIEIDVNLKLNKFEYLGVIISDWLSDVIKDDDSQFISKKSIISSASMQLLDVTTWLDNINKTAREDLARLESGQKKPSRISYRGLNNLIIYLNLRLVDNQLTFQVNFLSQLEPVTV